MTLASRLAVAALLLVSASVDAQTYPSEPVRIVVPFLPGGGVDVAEAAGTTPDEFAAKYQADIVRYAKIIRDAKVPLAD